MNIMIWLLCSMVGVVVILALLATFRKHRKALVILLALTVAIVMLPFAYFWYCDLSFSGEGYSKVDIGMSDSEVLKLIGTPSSKTTLDVSRLPVAESWQYKKYLSYKFIVVQFNKQGQVVDHWVED